MTYHVFPMLSLLVLCDSYVVSHVFFAALDVTLAGVMTSVIKKEKHNYGIIQFCTLKLEGFLIVILVRYLVKCCKCASG